MSDSAFRSLSIVVPVFDEEANVDPLVTRIVAAARPLGLPFELIVIDDGSRDRTRARLRDLARVTPELVLLGLRRNLSEYARGRKVDVRTVIQYV